MGDHLIFAKGTTLLFRCNNVPVFERNLIKGSWAKSQVEHSQFPWDKCTNKTKEAIFSSWKKSRGLEFALKLGLTKIELDVQKLKTLEYSLTNMIWYG